MGFGGELTVPHDPASMSTMTNIQAAPISAVSPKSRTVASILGFFLGGIGVDRFYLGNIGMGVAKLLVGWLTFGIWPLIDWVIILAGSAHDGDGLPVTRWE
jgi:TM2 domain-containing membrane protein YozV